MCFPGRPDIQRHLNPIPLHHHHHHDQVGRTENYDDCFQTPFCKVQNRVKPGLKWHNNYQKVKFLICLFKIRQKGRGLTAAASVKVQTSLNDKILAFF